MGLFRAAWWEGGSVRDVMKWAERPEGEGPAAGALPARTGARRAGGLLDQHRRRDADRASTRTRGPPVSALRDEKVLAWVTPDKHRPRFDPEHFATEQGHPLPAVARRAARRARSSPPSRTRCSPPAPKRASGTAAACPSRCAPSWTRPPTSAKSPTCPTSTATSAAGGSRPFVILQSYRQGVKAWGEVGMDAMWSAATKKLDRRRHRRRQVRPGHRAP